MTGLEAIPKITALLRELIQHAKDRETQALVQEIQTHQLIIQTDLMEARAKMLQMETDHAHAITAIREGQRLEIVQLNSQIAQLKAQQPQPKADDLEQGAIAVLKLFFDAGRDVSGRQIAQRFNMHPSVVDHHIDKLFEKRFITQATVGDTGANCSYRIEPKGRDYIIKSGLFDPNQRPPQRPPNDLHRLGMT